jgi:hypothetical protein
MLLPLYGFLRGDSLGIVVLVQHDDPVHRIATTVMQAAAMRVRPAASASVYFEGRRLPPQLSASEAGLTALDRIDVHPDAPSGDNGTP